MIILWIKKKATSSKAYETRQPELSVKKGAALEIISKWFLIVAVYGCEKDENNNNYSLILSYV